MLFRRHRPLATPRRPPGDNRSRAGAARVPDDPALPLLVRRDRARRAGRRTARPRAHDGTTCRGAADRRAHARAHGAARTDRAHPRRARRTGAERDRRGGFRRVVRHDHGCRPAGTRPRDSAMGRARRGRAGRRGPVRQGQGPVPAPRARDSRALRVHLGARQGGGCRTAQRRAGRHRARRGGRGCPRRGVAAAPGLRQRTRRGRGRRDHDRRPAQRGPHRCLRVRRDDARPARRHGPARGRRRGRARAPRPRGTRVQSPPRPLAGSDERAHCASRSPRTPIRHM